MYCPTPSRAQQALRASGQHELHDCGTCRAFAACSALSPAVRGINVPVVNERLSRFGRFKFEHHGRDRTVVLNEERELPDAWGRKATCTLTGEAHLHGARVRTLYRH